MQSAPSHSRWYVPAARRATDVPGGIICLRLNGELCADAVDVLSDTVIARLTAASTRTETVVLDLSATAMVDDQARTALASLQRRLADLTIRLRLVAVEPEIYATLKNSGRHGYIGHCAVRARHGAVHRPVRGGVLRAAAP